MLRPTIRGAAAGRPVGVRVPAVVVVGVFLVPSMRRWMSTERSVDGYRRTSAAFTFDLTVPGETTLG